MKEFLLKVKLYHQGFTNKLKQSHKELIKRQLEAAKSKSVSIFGYIFIELQ